MSEYILKGMILPFNVKSSIHGGVYTKESVKKAFDKFRKKVSEGEAYGCLETRHFPVVEATGYSPVEYISHQIKSVEMTDEGILAEIKVLNTKEGDLVKQLMDHDIALYGGISGLGMLGEDGFMELHTLNAIHLTCCSSFNPDVYYPLMPIGAASNILKKELEYHISRNEMCKKLKEHDE